MPCLPKPAFYHLAGRVALAMTSSSCDRISSRELSYSSPRVESLSWERVQDAYKYSANDTITTRSSLLVHSRFPTDFKMPSRCCTTISHLLALLVFTFLNLSRAQDLSSTQVHLTPISHDGPLCPPESSILKTSIISVPGNTTHLIHHTLPYFRPPIAPNIPAASQRAHCT
ncbi:hypothetical protein K458DRAFT_39699 [Lentithecium fluviatile CBS 122367]|uniref:Uncharacterized protein n=1 Tax=Lentithecium fluviatile CBS 122367 TaxID=1168545 RepID=A0A6G1IZB7_9PLEO|nr:hypothetical protein K458DRAFT_39699 [Lentithecium fluviatile CBS 122367]